MPIWYWLLTYIISNQIQLCLMLIDEGVDDWLIANGYCWKSVSNWLVWSMLIGELLIYIIFIWLIYYIITKSNTLQANWIYLSFFYWAQLFTLCYLIWNQISSNNIDSNRLQSLTMENDGVLMIDCQWVWACNRL